MTRCPPIAATLGAGLCAALIAAGAARPARATTVTPGPPDGADFDQLLHGAAYSYAEGDMLTASNSVHRALALEPDDPQAEALRKLIEQTPPEPPEDQQQEDQQQEQQQQQKDRQEQKEKPDQEKEEQQQQDAQQEQEQQQPAEPQPSEQQQADPAEAEPKEPGQLTPEEARMLLDALRQLDMVLPIRPPETGRLPAVLKDW